MLTARGLYRRMLPRYLNLQFNPMPIEKKLIEEEPVSPATDDTVSNSSISSSSRSSSDEELNLSADGVTSSEQTEAPAAPATVRKPRRLRFDNLVKVTLIPSIQEYRDAGLHPILWSNKAELALYQNKVFTSIQTCLLKNSLFKGDLKKGLEEICRNPEDYDADINEASGAEIKLTNG